MTAFKLQRLL